jgi:hypothetical protein
LWSYPGGLIGGIVVAWGRGWWLSQLGLTAVGNVSEQADASYREAEAVLLAEAASALEPATLACPNATEGGSASPGG